MRSILRFAMWVFVFVAPYGSGCAAGYSDSADPNEPTIQRGPDRADSLDGEGQNFERKKH